MAIFDKKYYNDGKWTIEKVDTEHIHEFMILSEDENYIYYVCTCGKEKKEKKEDSTKPTGCRHDLLAMTNYINNVGFDIECSDCGETVGNIDLTTIDCSECNHNSMQVTNRNEESATIICENCETTLGTIYFN